MSEQIKQACYKVARTNLSGEKLLDLNFITSYQKQLTSIALDALERYSDLGATEPDIVNAINYINHIYAIPPIKDNPKWFDSLLDTLLSVAFPNAGLTEESKPFARKLGEGIKESLCENDPPLFRKDFGNNYGCLDDLKQTVSNYYSCIKHLFKTLEEISLDYQNPFLIVRESKSDYLKKSFQFLGEQYSLSLKIEIAVGYVYLGHVAIEDTQGRTLSKIYINEHGNVLYPENNMKPYPGKKTAARVNVESDSREIIEYLLEGAIPENEQLKNNYEKIEI
ncbi:hypothetical protein [Zooshikella ganghwensis]|uniref:Uncharacterized protein n=1 Tax=Zooshikella ganghwensis TaxID=202772 RepID=A0A4P9VH32_9GAMM|nr:hypothetical protein [Zooshikella ganghwensis]RDH41427.1 hypothetical protein B9G39_28635 [Zooshikella ganghwensis]